MLSLASSRQNDFAPAMYAMPHHQYAYAAAPPPPPPRQYATHGTSSAFSSSANPDEDWTKISDLAERRRIQNRIAQRNYRKKLKRRLEDLERRAGSSDGSTSPTSEKQPSPNPASKTTKKASPSLRTQKPAAPQKQVPAPQFTPPMGPEDELLFGNSAPGYDDHRGRSHTPPQHYLPYSTYPPPPEDMMAPPFGSHQPYQPMTTAEGYPSYMATTVPCTLPSMTHFSDAMKREPYHDESMTPYMNYGYVQGMPYDHHSNSHTPPLSHSFDHSANCSESGYEYPTTPLSMPGTPPEHFDLSHHHQH